MKRNVKMNKKISVLLALSLLISSSYAQEANDGFVVPLNEDFSKAVSAAPAQASTAGNSSVAQGAWIELTSSNKAIIRDIATNEKSGYEFDNSHLLSNLNWWFWGDITPSFHLDAEISVYDFDKTIYQSNSYADNDPTVSWKDGFHELYSMPFSFMHNGNDNTVGSFNKFGFTLINPYFETKIGYGKLKAGGMLDFDGIYHVIDRWESVEKGFTELSLGKDLQKIGDFTVNATAALSMMRGTYGLYDLLDVKYGDEKAPLIEFAATFGSKTESEKLYDYNKDNINAFSTYLAVAPIEPLKIEFHMLGTFGTDLDLEKETLAFAGRGSWQAEKWSLRVMESLAGSSVNSVWGSDGQAYDDINAGKLFTQADFAFAPLEWFSFGLDEGLTLPSYDDETFALSFASDTSAEYSLRNEPYFDFDLERFLATPLTLASYGVIYADKAVSGKKNKQIITLQEAGAELAWAPDFSMMKKLKFDYATSSSYNKWTSSAGSSYKKNVTYHSMILKSDITDNFNVFGGMLYRAYENKTDKNQPLGFALGFAVNKTPLPGHPKLWAHFAYGMDPFEDNNYSLYRADDPLNKPIHRTYLLNTLDDNNYNSFVRVGLIWDL
ncbi:hypothetical protein [uncultured Treponema sp.]|uniref:hypothetical protein n=1 Tax=uncultured Treponema sp. TaxID=162155 RepID=UPI0025D498BE|nr:hypothetical protein [uncultured Treponema sp.]